MNRNTQVAILAILIAPAATLIIRWVEPNLDWGLDFTIGLLFTIIALQIEHMIRIDKNLDKRRKYEGFWLSLEKNSWLKEQVEHILLANEKNDNNNNNFFNATFKYELETVKNRLLKLAGGKIEINQIDDILPNLRAWSTVEKEVLSISTSEIDSVNWWSSSQGQNYLKLNKDATNRGVRVERIFIFSGSEKELERIMELNKKVGVDVYMLEKDKIPPKLRLDFIIFDNSFCHEAKTNSDGERIANIYSINKLELLKKNEDFESIKSFAKKIE